MIDKIVLTLNDSGKFEINVGDIHHVTAHSPMEAMKTINNHIRHLAYFPTGKYPMSANPIPLEYFKNKK